MKKSLIFLIVLAVNAHTATDIQRLVEQKCSSCHMLNSSTKIKQDKISAPPMWGVMRKVKDAFSTKEEGIAYLIDYVKYPHEDKMIFPKATKEYFGLMPSLKDEISEEELKDIAQYLYRN